MNHTPFHPFMTGHCIESADDCEDAINRCTAALNLLSELFGSNADDFDFLNTQSARMGMYFQLQSIASVLEAVSRHGWNKDREQE